MVESHYTKTDGGITYEIEVVRILDESLRMLYGRIDSVSLEESGSAWPSTVTIPDLFNLGTIDGKSTILYVSEIGAYSFNGSVKVENLVLGENCSRILNKAMYFNDSLKTIQISSSLSEVQPYSVAGCNRLTDITGNGGSFTTSNGVLYDGNKVVLGANKQTITFKPGTTAIGESAFSFCDRITSISIPETVTEIGRYAFSDCTGLMSLNIPSTIEEVGYGSFFGCSGIKEIFITPTEKIVPREMVWLRGLSFASMDSLEVVHMGGSVGSIYSVIGEETFSGGGRNLYFDEPRGDPIEGDIKKMLTGTVGTLPSSISIEFIGIPGFSEPYVVSVSPGSTLQAALSSAMGQIPSGYDFLGWYYDSGYSESVSGSQVVSNYYKDEFGEVKALESIEIYARVQEKYDISKVFVTQVTQEPTDGKKGAITLVSVKDWDEFRKAAYYIPDVLENTETNKSYNVTILGENLFEGGTLSSSMTIPWTVKRIGKSSFKGHSELTSVAFGSSSSETGSKPSQCSTIDALAFSDTGITSFTFPNSVKIVRKGVFYNCKSLETVTIGSSMASFGIEVGKGRGTFEGCDAIGEVVVDSLSHWMGIDFGFGSCNPLSNGAELYIGASKLTSIGSANIESGITSVKPFAFIGCSSISSVDFTMTSIGEIGAESFSVCGNLQQVTFTNGITAIGRASFSNCGVTSISIPSSVTTVGEFMFNGCDSLTTVSVDSSVISHSMFSSCIRLSKVNIGTNVSEIGESAFSGDCELGVVSLGDSSILNNIAERAFYNTIAIFHYVIENDQEVWTNDSFEAVLDKDGNMSITQNGDIVIPKGVFEGNQDIIDLTIGTGVNKIPDRMFFGCSNIVDVYLGEQVTEISDSAFEGCTSITDVTVSLYPTLKGIMQVFPSAQISSVKIIGNIPTLSIKGLPTSGIETFIIDSTTDLVTTHTIYGGSYYSNLISIGDNVKELDESALVITYESRKRELVIGKNVTSMGLDAIGYNSRPPRIMFNRITFKGNCPSYVNYPLGGSEYTDTTPFDIHVPQNSTGWEQLTSYYPNANIVKDQPPI